MKKVVFPAVIAVILMGSFAYAEKIWHIKAVDPDGQFIDIKALDKQGNIHDVKAIEDGDLHIMPSKPIAPSAGKNGQANWRFVDAAKAVNHSTSASAAVRVKDNDEPQQVLAACKWPNFMLRHTQLRKTHAIKAPNPPETAI